MTVGTVLAICCAVVVVAGFTMSLWIAILLRNRIEALESDVERLKGMTR